MTGLVLAGLTIVVAALVLRSEVWGRAPAHAGRARSLPLEFVRGTFWAGYALVAVGSFSVLALSSRHSECYYSSFLLGTLAGLALARGRAWWHPALLLACSIVPLAALDTWLERGPDEKELPAEGDSIIAALEAYRREHGRFPATLAEADLAPRWNRYGGWSYAPRDGGRSWSLQVGEYDRDGFVLYRQAGDENWQWDS